MALVYPLAIGRNQLPTWRYPAHNTTRRGMTIHTTTKALTYYRCKKPLAGVRYLLLLPLDSATAYPGAVPYTFSTYLCSSVFWLQDCMVWGSWILKDWFTWIPAPVMIPIRKLGTMLATAIIRLSTIVTWTKSERTKYPKWSKPWCSCAMKYTMELDTSEIRKRNGSDDSVFPTTKANTP